MNLVRRRTPILIAFQLSLWALISPLCFALEKINISDLHPTQFCIGKEYVKDQAKKLMKKSEAELHAYLKERPAKIILGPHQKTYIIDRHHLAAALLKNNKKHIYATVVKNWASLSSEVFWQRMRESDFVYLYDENGKGPLDLKDLPKKLEDLKDDPYRSLASFVREAGGYKKTETPFAEFQWAGFFRKRLKIGHSPVHKNSILLQNALELAHSPEAKDLPGYIGSCSGFLH